MSAPFRLHPHLDDIQQRDGYPADIRLMHATFDSPNRLPTHLFEGVDAGAPIYFSSVSIVENGLECHGIAVEALKSGNIFNPAHTWRRP